MRLRKTGYYARSLMRLAGTLRHRRALPGLVVHPQRVELADGAVFSIADRLDLLILVETVCVDAYGLSELRTPKLIVDVGAGFGDFAITAARRFPGCRVIACEPNPTVYALLEENVAANRLRTVETLHVAVGTAPRYRAVRSHHRARTITQPAGATDATADADGCPLDAIIGAEAVDLLKIDCEGCELEVLASASDRTLAQVARVVLEYHTVDGSSLARPVLEQLGKAGFQTRSASDRYDAGIGYIVAWRPPSA